MLSKYVVIVVMILVVTPDVFSNILEFLKWFLSEFFCEVEGVVTLNLFLKNIVRITPEFLV